MTGHAQGGARGGDGRRPLTFTITNDRLRDNVGRFRHDTLAQMSCRSLSAVQVEMEESDKVYDLPTLNVRTGTSSRIRRVADTNDFHARNLLLHFDGSVPLSRGEHIKTRIDWVSDPTLLPTD